MVGLIGREICPICGRPEGFFRKTFATVAGAHICVGCFKRLLDAGMSTKEIYGLDWYIDRYAELHGIRPDQVLPTQRGPAHRRVDRRALIPKGSVPVVHPDGRRERIPEDTVIDESTSCLVADHGETYHTRADCFRKWDREYGQGFTHWNLIPIEEADARGLRKCFICEEADFLASRRHPLYAGWDEFRNDEPLLSFTACVEDADGISVGDEAYEEWGDGGRADVLQVGGRRVGRIPEEVCDRIYNLEVVTRMFVIDVAGCLIEIGVYADD